MATHSSTLALRIPWTEEPSGLQSIGCKEWAQLKELTQHKAFTRTPLFTEWTNRYELLCDKHCARSWKYSSG